jgi:hypothetical protein
MPTSFRRLVGFLITAATLAAPSARADGLVRVRVESPYLRSLVARATDRSAKLRGLIGQIEGTNVIVHLVCERFSRSTLRGRTLLGMANQHVRYVRVQVDCMLQERELVAIVGHELQHVAEIAAAAEVVDGRSLSALYRAIGFPTCGFGQSEQFETGNAIRVGERVREEFSRSAAAH